MSHHGHGLPIGLPEEMSRVIRDERLGATGEFPEGKLGVTDEGELKLAVSHDKGVVVVAFGKEVSWIGFSPEQARSLAALFLEHAESLDGIVAKVRRESAP